MTRIIESLWVLRLRTCRQRYLGVQAGPARLAVSDREYASQVLHTLCQATQPEVARAGPLFRQANTVVCNRYHNPLGIGLHVDAYVRGLRMAQGVDQTLLYHAIDRQRNARAQVSCERVPKR